MRENFCRLLVMMSENNVKKLCQTAKPESNDQVDRPKIRIRQFNFQFESEAQIIHCLY